MGYQWTLVVAGCFSSLAGEDAGFREQFIVGYRLIFRSLAIAAIISGPSSVWLRVSTIVLEVAQAVSLRCKLNPSVTSVVFAEKVLSNRLPQTLTDAMGGYDVDAAQSFVYKTRIHA